jgi:hypothetical protein
MDVTHEMQSLLEKLDALELTEAERTAFGQLLGVEGAEEVADVEGFASLKDAARVNVQGFNLGVVLERNLVLGKGPVPTVVDHKSDDRR